MGWEVDGMLGLLLGAALTVSPPWWEEPWLWVRRGDKEGHRPFSFSEGLGAWVCSREHALLPCP